MTGTQARGRAFDQTRRRCYAARDVMNADGNALLASLLIGSVGFVLFAYGKSQRRLPQMLVGVALMGFPYFVASLPLMFGIAALLLAALWLMLRLGL